MIGNLTTQWFQQEVEVIDERQIVNSVSKTVTLDYIPSSTRPLAVKYNGLVLTEVNSNPTIYQYVADRDNGVLYFNDNMSNKTIIANYVGIGRWCIGADKIYTNVDNKGDVLETLHELLQKNIEIIDSVKTVGDGATPIRIGLDDIPEDVQNGYTFFQATLKKIITFYNGKWYCNGEEVNLG